ncbi:MAG: hypothetical protein OEW19_17615, partial [Acidobacteriota bacterium]|nr:hypothetical protein [Acidobacteriota bacterium]
MTDRRDALDEAIDRAAAAWLEPSPDPLFAARVLEALPAGARVPMWRAWWWQAAAATVAAIAVTAYLPSRSADAVPVIASPLARMAPLAVVVADRPGAERAAGLPVQPGSRAVRPVMVEAAAPGGQQGIAPLPL